MRCELGRSALVGFLLGALLLCIFSFIQKLLIGVNPFIIEGYIVPFFFGGTMGAVIGCLVQRERILLMERMQVVNSEVEKRTAELKRANEELKKSEQRYRLLFTSMGEGVAIHRLVYDEHSNPVDYIIEEVNPQFEHHVGLKAEEVVGRKATEVYGTKDAPYLDIYAQVAETGTPTSFDTYFAPMDKYFSVSVFSSERGKFATVFTDITERKRTEEALKQSEELYRAIFESTGTAMAIVEEDGTISLANSKLEALSGYSREEVEKKRSWTEFVAEEDLERMKEYHRLRRQDPDAAPREYEFRLIDRDGNVKHVALSIAPISGTGRSVISLLDITERKEAQERLRESEERFRAISESATDAIIMMDDEGKARYWNRAAERMFGYASDEVIGKSVHHLIAPERYHEAFERGFSRFRHTGEGPVVGKTLELFGLKKDGTEFPIELSISSIKVEGRWSAVALIRDITERKAAERAQAELTEVLKLLNSILRHDILNNLNVVGLSLEIFERKEDKKYLESCRRAVNKSVELIRRMKDLESLISRGEELKPMSVRAVVEEVAGDYSVDFSVDGDCTVLADDALRSVIDNIVRNAVVHGKTDRVEVRIGGEDGTCEVRVADFGVGIPDELKHRVFEKGFKHGETGHTGLGLYIVKRVIERYGGEVFVENNEPTGTVFVLRLKSQKGV